MNEQKQKNKLKIAHTKLMNGKKRDIKGMEVIKKILKKIQKLS